MVLSLETIRSHLAGFTFAANDALDIVVLDEIGSTNDWVLAQCKQGCVLPLACFAEKQTSGRGRRGKQWLQSKNANIAMSLALRPDFERDAIAHLALVVAMSVVDSLAEMGVKECQIKWPNDVLVAGEKIAGILIETVPLPKVDAQANESHKAGWAVIIGIGLNYDMSELADADLIDVAWTDLVSVLGESGQQSGSGLSRTEMAAVLLKNCLEFCLAYPDNIPDLRARYTRQYDYCKGKQVELLLYDGETVCGLVTGLNEQAELIVEIDGMEQTFHSAEVSVRPVTKED